MKQTRQAISKEQREAERERKLAIRQEKRREKHKGRPLCFFISPDGEPDHQQDGDHAPDDVVGGMEVS